MNNNPCEVNANNIKKLEERVSKLEANREKDKTEVHELDTSLKVFITEMKGISSELQGIVANFKEAIVRSNTAQEKELNHLKEQVVEQGKRIEKLDAKLEAETVEADAKRYHEIIKYVATGIIGIVIGFIAMYLGLK